jgi:flagellar hook-length control protein FliK
MPIQENRTAAGIAADPFIAIRGNQQSFAKPGADSDSSLFADIFKSFAVSPSPSATPADFGLEELPSSNSLEQASESAKATDEERSDDEVDPSSLAFYAISPGSQPGVVSDVNAFNANDVHADSTGIASADNDGSQNQLVNENVSIVGGADGAIRTEALTDEAPREDATKESPEDQTPANQAQSLVSVTNHNREEVQDAKQPSESGNAVATSAQAHHRSASQGEDSSSENLESTGNASVAGEQTLAGATDRQGGSSNDRGDRRRRNSDSGDQPSSVDRQASARDQSADSARATSTSGLQEPSSLIHSHGAGAPESGVASANPSTSQMVQASAGSLAALPSQLSASQRAAGGVLGQGSQSASGTQSVQGLHQDREISSESAGANSASSSRRTDIADRARLVHRIAKAFQRMGIDSGQVRLKMHPDELGGVQIDMQVNGRSVKAKVIADGEEARQLLQDSLPELRQRLESQGLTVERLDVELRSEGDGSSLMNQNQQRQGSDPNNDAARRDGVWRRPLEARNDVNTFSLARPESRQPVRSMGTDRALDLKG